MMEARKSLYLGFKPSSSSSVDICHILSLLIIFLCLSLISSSPTLSMYYTATVIKAGCRVHCRVLRNNFNFFQLIYHSGTLFSVHQNKGWYYTYLHLSLSFSNEANVWRIALDLFSVYILCQHLDLVLPFSQLFVPF